MAGTTDILQRWRERWARRENLRRQRAYEASLAVWRRDDTELRQMLAAGREFRGLASERVPPSFKLRRSEAVLWIAPGAQMVEVQDPPALHRPGYREFSLVQVRGPFLAPCPPHARLVDLGPVAVTNQRVIFQGSMRGREWALAKLVGVAHDANAPCTLMQVSNRKRASGLLVDPAAVPGFRFNLALGLADAAGDRAGFVAHLDRLHGDHQRLMPHPAAPVTPQEAPHPARIALGIATKIYLGPADAPARRRVAQFALAVLATLAVIGVVIPDARQQPDSLQSGATQATTSAGTDESSGPEQTTAAPTTSPSSSWTAPAAAPTGAAPPLPMIEKKTVTITRTIPFKKRSVNDPSLKKDTTVVTTRGVNGTRRVTYEVILTDGVETGRRLVNDVIVTPPVTQVTALGTRVDRKPKPAAGCDPNYSGACVPIATDVDCAGGSGNGPAYVDGPVRVIGRDIYRLDDDDDRVGCDT